MRMKITTPPGHPEVREVELEGDCNEQAAQDGQMLNELVEFLQKNNIFKIALNKKSVCHSHHGVYAATFYIGT